MANEKKKEAQKSRALFITGIIGYAISAILFLVSLIINMKGTLSVAPHILLAVGLVVLVATIVIDRVPAASALVERIFAKLTGKAVGNEQHPNQ